MITLDAFLSAIQENIARITHYESGGDGKGGGCDCIGLIIGAVRLAGGTWDGTHGSNYAARSEMTAFGRVSDLYLGEVVYKAKSPTDSGYALPERYKGSGDLLDYYHVGVVTNVNPLIITHCTGVPGGIKEDNQPGQWQYGGQLKMVEYQPIEPLYEAVVTAVSGRTVHLRAKPNTQSTILKSVPVGSKVEVLEEVNADWAKIRYLYYDGYMMRKFLEVREPSDLLTEIHEAIAALDKAKSILMDLIGGDGK